jgi:cytochrome d ubiquinol oxidase subunit I
VVYGLLRTSDALSAAVTANQVLFSLIMFTLVYLLLFLLFMYLLNKKIKAGPYDESETEERPLQHGMAEVLDSRKEI